MAIKLGDAFVELFGKRDKLNQDLGAAKEDTRAWTVAVGTMAGNLMIGVIKKTAEIATKAIVGLGKSLVDMTLEAAQVEGVRNTFNNLVETIGGDAVKAMNDLRFATRGMVSDADLMLAGNKFLAMGLAETTDQAAELAEIATQLGMAMGEDATASMENFALMMANQSIPRLDSFGISSGKVRERIEELMAATEGLTREQAFNQAVMEQARVTMQKVGEQGDTAAAGMARIGATLENLKLKGGQALQPILDLFVHLGETVIEKWGPKLEEWLGFITGPIENFAGAFRALIDGDINGFLQGINDALVGLGVPQETIDKVNISLSTLFSAFQDLKDGNIEEFIGKVKAVLGEWGVPVEIIDDMERAFRWLLKAAEDVSAFVEDPLKPTMKKLWEKVLKPALEGLRGLLTDVKPKIEEIKDAFAGLAKGIEPHLKSVWAKLLKFWQDLGQIGKEEFLPAVNDLRDAFDHLGEALGLNTDKWGGLGEVIGNVIGWLIEAGVDIWIFQLTLGVRLLGKAIEWVANFIESWATIFEFLRDSGIMDRIPEIMQVALDVAGIGQLPSGNQNQDNSRQMTVYGGIQMFGAPGFGDALKDLWEMGQT